MEQHTYSFRMKNIPNDRLIDKCTYIYIANLIWFFVNQLYSNDYVQYIYRLSINLTTVQEVHFEMI